MASAEWVLDSSGAFDNDFERLRDKTQGIDFDGCTLFLTGATGFFGLWLVEFFDWLRRAKRVDITVYVLTRDPEAVFAHRRVYRERPWLHLTRGDIRTFEPPRTRIDYILHGAADTSAQAGRSAFELFDVLCGGARHVLDIAANVGCRRVLLISSGAVYGSVLSSEKIHESRLSAPDTMLPSSAYGEGKRVSEALGTFAAQAAPFEVVTARCFAFVGAGLALSGHFAIGNFVKNAIENRNVLLNSTGKSQRSYLYAADLVIWLARLALQGRAGAAYNVGSDQELDIHATACLVRDVLAPDCSVSVADNASTVVSYYVPQIERARSELGLDVWTPIGLAVRRTAEDARRFGPIRSLD